MASTLCVKARRDIRVVTGIVDSSDETLVPEPTPQIAHLVKLMRATCIDVAESATSSDIQLANSTLYVARAVKKTGAEKDGVIEQLPVDGLPADQAYMTWDKVVQYVDNPFGEMIRGWSQNCTLPALMHMRSLIECSDTALAMLYDDLIKRSASSIPNDLGALIKYRVIMLDAPSYQSHWQRHAYFFETAIVVMSDGEVGFTPISMNTRSEHPLKLLHLIYFRDITAIVPNDKLCSSIYYIYDLTFKHHDGRSDLTLWFNDLPTAVAWATGVTRLRYRDVQQQLDRAATEDVAAFESFAAVMQAFRWQLAISRPLGRVRCHGTVVLRGTKKSAGRCQLVLFDQTLIFIQGSPPQAKRHLFASRIMSIAKTPVIRPSIILTYRTEFDEYIQFEEFSFEPTLGVGDTDARTWLRMLCIFAPNASTLPDTHLKLRSLAHKHTQQGRVRQLEESLTWDAGLAMLHATSIPDELNISVAVLPDFESGGLATHLIAHVLEVAFEKLDGHRVQARVVHSSTNPSQTARAIRMLIHLGFTHEGIRRGAARHPIEGQWADVSVLAMLQLDWVARAGVVPAKGTLWDEMFTRQQREREMLRNMEGTQSLKRTRSMETVRDLHAMEDAAPSASMVSSSVGWPIVMSDDTSQVSAPTTTSSLGEISSGSSLQTTGSKGSGIASLSSADDAADEYEEWDLEEDYSDEDEEETSARLKE